MTEETWRAQHEIFERAFVALVECPVPVIAAVNGHAYGGGLENALACDFIYAVRSARFALSEVRLGIMPGGGGTQTLARAVGERRAKELIMSRAGLQCRAGAGLGPDQPPERTRARCWTTRWRGSRHRVPTAPMSIRQAKRSIHYGLQGDLATGYRFEIEAYNRLVDTEDRHEGVRAFNEKRKADFKGR
jgi:enoyl-CoA hydratase